MKCNNCKRCSRILTYINNICVIDFICKAQDNLIMKSVNVDKYDRCNEPVCETGDCKFAVLENNDSNLFSKSANNSDVKQKTDNVNHPSHYTWLKEKCGIEVIDITRHFNFDIGNALKYILRAGHKNDADKTHREKEIEDFKKARWYIDDHIKNLENDVH